MQMNMRINMDWRGGMLYLCERACLSQICKLYRKFPLPGCAHPDLLPVFPGFISDPNVEIFPCAPSARQPRLKCFIFPDFGDTSVRVWGWFILLGQVGHCLPGCCWYIRGFLQFLHLYTSMVVIASCWGFEVSMAQPTLAILLTVKWSWLAPEEQFMSLNWPRNQD